jgi:ABC-type nitrate/sulfonate/bicarbonate transport system permease component
MATAPTPRVGRSLATRLYWPVAPLLPLAAVVVAWWLITVGLDQRSRVFPSPWDVVLELRRIAGGETPLGDSSYLHFAATLARLVVAFTISFVIGTALGILAGRKKVVFDLLNSVVWVLLSVPSIVWVFIFAVAIGLGNAVPIASLCALLTPLVLINVAEGAKSIPAELTEMAAAFHVGRRQLAKDVFVPYLIPYLVGAARVSFALGIRIVTVVEVIGLSHGVGYLLTYWNQSVEVAPIVAWGVIFIVCGLAVDNFVFAPLERRTAKGREIRQLRREVV